MKHIITKLIIVFCMIICYAETQAQSSVTAAGGDASGTGGSASYSFGQVFYSFNTATNGSELQGVQQPYEISIIIATEEAKNVNLSWLVYPNPSSGFIKLETPDLKLKNLSYQLYDIQGKLIADKAIISKETIIDMTTLLSSIYYLKVKESRNEVKTFKIIKN